jgi:hypothetical protein
METANNDLEVDRGNQLLPLQGVSLFDVCTIRKRRKRVAPIAAKMSTKPLADCHLQASFAWR